MKSGMPSCFCRLPPGMTLFRLGLGCRRGLGFRPGRREQNPQTPQPGRERSGINRTVPVAWWQERSTPDNGRVPSSRRDQLRATERRPAGEGLKHSNRRTGPGTRDLNTPSIRSVLPARDSNTPRQQRSLLGQPLGKARAEGETPRFLGRETLEKPDNGVIVARFEAPEYPLQVPSAKC